MKVGGTYGNVQIIEDGTHVKVIASDGTDSVTVRLTHEEHRELLEMVLSSFIARS